MAPKTKACVSWPSRRLLLSRTEALTLFSRAPAARAISLDHTWTELPRTSAPDAPLHTFDRRVVSLSLTSAPLSSSSAGKSVPSAASHRCCAEHQKPT
ncbi:hypothetical protein DL93DRAFT_2077079 [Clavulina sp. PMI_390]|nr:hypothetical protein DL93DRAFT_2077079 [Clavulina sp. PMI_390]